MTTDDNRPAPTAANAVTHGLTARNITIPAEDPREWDDHAASILDSYEPQTPLERALAIRVAELFWRLRRVTRFESHSIADRQREVDDTYRRRQEIAEEDATAEPPRVPFPVLLPRAQDAGRILRYETRINRQLMQAMHELEALQSRRHGKHTPLARVDFLSLARDR